MTTIACDGKSMAGDGMAVTRGTITERRCVKVWRMADGSLVGCAGHGPDGVAFAAWRDGGVRPRIRQQFEALVLSPSGELTYHCEKDLDGIEAEVPTAIGSGMDYAIGAMDAGASPERAIDVAAGRDPRTGGKVTVLHLEAARLKAA